MPQPLKIASLILIIVLHVCVLNGQSDSDKISGDEYLEKAQLSYDSAGYDLALDWCGQAILYFQNKNEPESLMDAYLLEAQALNRIGDYQGALLSIDPVFTISANNDLDDSIQVVQANIQKGINHRFLGNYDEAVSYFEKAIVLGELMSGEAISLVAEANNDIGIILQKKGKYDEALARLNKAVELYDNYYGKKHLKTALTIENIGIVYRRIREYDKALEYHWKAVEIYTDTLGRDYYKLSLPYNSIGTIYKRKGDLKKALQYYQKALAIHENHFGENHAQSNAYLSNIGNVLKDLGAYRESLDYHLKGLQVRQKHWGGDHWRTNTNYYSIGLLLSELEEYDKSLEYVERSINIFLSKYGEWHPRLAGRYNSLGHIFLAMKKYDEALNNFEKALSIVRKKFDDKYPFAADIKNNIGLVHMNKGAYGKAMDYFSEAVEISSGALGSTHPKVARHYNNIGNLYAKNNSFGQSIDYYERALRALNYEEKNELPFDVVNDRLLVLQTFKNLGDVFLKRYHRDRGERDLFRAKEYMVSAITLMDFISSTYLESESQQILKSHNYGVFETAIEIDLILYENTEKEIYLESAFSRVEKSKSMQLLSAFRMSNVEKIAQLPDSLLVRENELSAKISFAEKRRFGLVGDDEIAMGELNGEIFTLKKQYRELVEKMESDYPAYYRLRHDLRLISIAEIQRNLLKDDQGLIEYFVGENFVCAFLVTPEKVKVEKIEIDFPLKEWVSGLSYGVHGYNLRDTKSLSDYDSSKESFKVHAYLLFEKILKNFGQLPEHLVVVPDDLLWRVPFDLLLTKKTETDYFKLFPYLLREHVISYNYSASLWQEMLEKKSNGSGLLAFAPDFNAGERVDDDSGGYLNTLRYNQSEASEIASLMKGELVLGREANLSHFFSEAPKYNLLHFATHAQANDADGDFCFLLLQNEDSSGFQKLFVKDLYGIDLSVDMVVLSACETGRGELQKGEGMASLSRGFAYAGANSMVTSLWQVNDKSTAFIMEEFYKNLANGEEKDLAMRNAKLIYINAQKEDRLASPYYWSAFIAVGDMEAIDCGASNKLYWICGAFFLLGLFFFFKKRIL